MDPHVALDNEHCEDKPVDKTLYPSTVGSLMFAALGTHPDIAFNVTAPSKCKHTLPLQMHMTAAKRVLRYPEITKNLRLFHPASVRSVPGSDDLHDFADSDWAGQASTRKVS